MEICAAVLTVMSLSLSPGEWMWMTEQDSFLPLLHLNSLNCGFLPISSIIRNREQSRHISVQYPIMGYYIFYGMVGNPDVSGDRKPASPNRAKTVVSCIFCISLTSSAGIKTLPQKVAQMCVLNKPECESITPINYDE